MCDSYELSPGQNFYSRFNTVNKLSSFPKDPKASVGQIQPVITFQEGLKLLWVMKWGLIPSWAKDRSFSNHMYNVSSSSLFTKPAFRQIIKNNRCLIPASAFYKNNKQKIPYLVTIEHKELFSFAGVYDVWQEPVSGHEVYTFALVTIPSNLQFKSYGETMPLILKSQDEDVWLNNKTPFFKIESIIKTSNHNFIFTQK